MFLHFDIYSLFFVVLTLKIIPVYKKTTHQRNTETAALKKKERYEENINDVTERMLLDLCAVH
jgi:hypothetical protein